jgi:hypothetical protein
MSEVISGECARWSVEGATWCDQLPDEIAALVAPPLIVSAESFTPRHDNTNTIAYAGTSPLPRRNRSARII